MNEIKEMKKQIRYIIGLWLLKKSICILPDGKIKQTICCGIYLLKNENEL